MIDPPSKAIPPAGGIFQQNIQIFAFFTPPRAPRRIYIKANNIKSERAAVMRLTILARTRVTMVGVGKSSYSKGGRG